MKFRKIEEIIKDVKNIAIVGHIRPDGDCIGASLGLYNYITENFQNIEVQVYLMKPLPGIFNYMKGYDKIKWEFTDKIYDLCICVDCSSIDRIEDAKCYFNNAKRTYCIDHHLTNLPFADEIYLIPESAATCELIVDILDYDKISKSCAECLYTGIITDTGVFKFKSTSKKTMKAATMLMDKGIDFSFIIDKAFFEKTYAQNQILGRVLMESILICNGKCIIGVVRQKDLEFYKIAPRHLEGIVNQLLNTKDVEVAIFIYELAGMTYKVSLRSKSYVDVAKVLQQFGGGGHKMAAGATMHGTVHDVINAITQDIFNQINMYEDKNGK